MMVFLQWRENCLQVNFKRGIAHDMNTQLRYLLYEALKVNLSAAFFCHLYSGILGYF